MKKVFCLSVAILMLGSICAQAAVIRWGNDIAIETNSGEEYVVGYNNAYMDDEEIFIIEKATEKEETLPWYVIREDNALYQYNEDSDEYSKKLDNVKFFTNGYALTYNNELYAWGEKRGMGIGVTESEIVTEPIKIMDDVREIVDADYGSFVIKTDGSLWAWGQMGHMIVPPDHSASYAMAYNQLGVGDDAEIVAIDAFFRVCVTAQKILDDVVKVYETQYVKFALTETGELYGWGCKKWNSLLAMSEDASIPYLLIDNVASFEAVGNTALAIRKDGSLWAWGEGFGGKSVEVVKNVAYVTKSSEYNSSYMFALCRNGDLYAVGNSARDLSDDLSFAVKISVGIKSIMYGDNRTALFITENDELYAMDKIEGKFKKLADDVIWAMADYRYNFHMDRPFVLYADKNNDLWHMDLTEDGESLGKILSDVKVEEREMPEFATIAVYVGVDSVVMDALPYIKNDRTMVPMRAIFERLGARVTWDDKTKTVIGVKGDTEIRITIGENVLYKNGEAIELDAPAEITNDRTMVPVRAISEAFGCTVNWNDETKTVKVIPDDGLTKTWYTYDEEGKLIYRKENTGIWVYTYDEKGNITRIDGPEIGYNEYAYDENGNEILYKGYDGYTVETKYDENGNKIWELQTYMGGRVTAPMWTVEKTWTYNDKGQCMSCTSGNTVTTYTYDDNGNLIKETESDGYWKEYTYDENNNLIYWVNSYESWKKFEYDENGNNVKEENSDGTVIVYMYNENNNKIHTAFTQGKYAGTYYKYEYDVNGNVVYSETN